MYKNLKNLKTDQYSEIVLALDETTNEKVILKKKKTGQVGFESYCHGLLNHPNIPKLKNVYSEEGLECMIIEYVEGATLDRLLQVGLPMSPDKVTRWLRQALVGLDYIHNQNIIHRDITPLNIVVGKDLDLRIIDFGISVPIGFQDETVAGNLNYAPPEQIMNPKAISIRSDIYSLGKTFLDVVNKTPYLYPKHLRMVLKKAMAMNPEDRYSSCKEMIHALKMAYS